MNQELFMEKMTEVLDCEQEITMETMLQDIEEWDSLSFVSFLAMVNVNTGKKIEPSKVREAECIGDLFKLTIE